MAIQFELPAHMFADSQARFAILPHATQVGANACRYITCTVSDQRWSRVYNALLAAPMVFFAENRRFDHETTLRLQRAVFYETWPRPLSNILIESLIELAEQCSQDYRQWLVRPICQFASLCARIQGAKGYEVFQEFEQAAIQKRFAIKELARFEGFDLSKSLADNLADNAFNFERVAAERAADYVVLLAVRAHIDAQSRRDDSPISEMDDTVLMRQRDLDQLDTARNPSNL
jgi:hypothetical protein